MTPPLACTVRSCRQPLRRQAREWVCANRHQFDIARPGYVNLLQPTDRRSLAAGDRRAAVEARARLRAAGVGQRGFDGFVDQARRLLASGPAAPVVVDLGSGSGETLAAIADGGAVAVGIDLSVDAAAHAARRFPLATWVVANADRALPLLTGRVDLVLSQQGRRHPDECARVLMPGGWLLISVPAPDDLWELRAAIHGDAVSRSRVEPILDAHAAGFELTGVFEIRERVALGRHSLLDLLRGTYRGERLSAAARIDELEGMDVTLASTLVSLRRR